MGQFGADTLITADAKLIICDCFDTLVELDGRRYQARRGVHAFLRHFETQRRIPVVVCSDGSEEHVTRALAEAELGAHIARIYHSGNAIAYDADGRPLKRLDLVLRDYGLGAQHAVFIGDSRLDAEAAQRHGLPFIRVPRGEDVDFSFTRLIGGPSRYHSGDFTDLLLKRYRGGAQP